MGEATTWARLGAAVAAAAGDDDKTPDTDALIEVVVLPVDAGWWTATDEDAPTTPTPPALNNELPPKAAMKATVELATLTTILKEKTDATETPTQTTLLY